MKDSNPILVKPSRLGPHKQGQRVDVLFFGESPGRDEIKTGRAFTGPAGQLIRTLIQGELPGRSIVLDNVCPEWLLGGKPKAKQFKKYDEYRQQSIARHKPRVVCLLGKDAFKAFGVKGGSTANAGKTIRKDNLDFVLSVHPSFVLRNNCKNIDIFRPVFQSLKLALKRKPPGTHRRITTGRELIAFLDKTRKQVCAFDLETSTFDPKTGVILCAAIASPSETVWVGLFHKDSWDAETNRWMEWLCGWWADGPRIIQNAKFELRWMRQTQRAAPIGCTANIPGRVFSGNYRQHDVTWMNPIDRSIWEEEHLRDPDVIHDTMIQTWLIDENQPRKLNWQVAQTLEKKPYWLAIPTDGSSYAEVPLETLGPYCANDAHYTRMLHILQRKRLTTPQKHLADDLFAPLIKSLVSMEEAGMRVDVPGLDRIRRSQMAKRNRLMAKAEQLFPGLDVNSPKQMRKLLFTDLGLKPVGVTKTTRVPSTDAEAIEKLVDQEPQLQVLSDAKKAGSLVDRVLTPWRDKHVTEKGYIHTAFNVGSTTTGRLSSSNPNMQNLDRDGPQRKVIVSRFKGGKIVQLDYEQHEYRIQGAVAHDQKILDVFRRGLDPHIVTRDDIIDRGVKVDRSMAKNINFGVLFEITEHGLYTKYKIPRGLGKSLIKLWYEAHPQVVKFHKDLERQMRSRGYIQNIFGMRRHLSDPSIGHERRQAYNFPVQGPAVLICFLALIEIDDWLANMPSLRSLIIHQIHDSIVLDCPAKEVKRVSRECKKMMEEVDLKPWIVNPKEWSDIPLAVDVKIGDHL